MNEIMADLLDKITKNKLELIAVGQKEIPLLFTQFFKDHPEVTSFGIETYTPYYCDGGECNRYSNWSPGEIQINALSPYHGEYPNDIDTNKISEIFETIGAEVFEYVYPDHSIVQFNRDGTVEILDHSDHD